MAIKKKLLSPRYQVWVDARNKFRLSHAHIQMARELGLNPKKLGSIANHDQERWKSPLPQFIEELYLERFGKDRPEVVMTIEQIVQKKQKKLNRQSPTKESTPITSGDDIDEDPF
ncbi:MAG: hypothetical protein WCS43_01485 [Verrucomicrobiota bacterium]